MAFFRSSSFFLSVLTSLLLWVSFPGGGEIWPILLVALIPLLYSLFGVNTRSAIFCGLSCGLVHFTLLLYWIVTVLSKYGGLHWFLAVPALLLLALYMSLYFALFALLARFILLVFPAAVSVWLLPALWVGVDWLRAVLFTGFPWMDLGYGLFEVPVLVQIADLVGHYGVTFLVVLVNTCLMLILRLIVTRKTSVVTYAFVLVPVLCLLGGAGAYSTNRFAEEQQTSAAPDTPRITVGIVQGNVDQSVKWSPAQQQDTVENYLRQTQALFVSSHPSLVVWPETALPFYPPSSEYMQLLRDMVAGNSFALLTGAPWYEIIDRKEKKVNFFNSALLLQPDGQYGGKYYKTHLVPFGEYVPLKKFLPFLAPLVEAVGDFRVGRIEHPLTWQQARAGVLICFESVFPDLSRQWVLAGANMLVNLTNDAWYGKSSAPHHSLAMAVLRAVETRRSLVRSANTGISAFVSPAGTILRQSELFVPWAATSEVTLSQELTIWARYGYLFAPFCLLAGLLGGLIAAAKRRWA
ncbi:apolipoprotein N-acyltransferase [Desulfopila sp. IMCC35006]|uniref:apolipoprotein N-acyltransferase n=1 Tax=Desulfopila sp. IMCC35006 TaxID=2569542 RepID=UPI00142E98FC|nr:apolipoprotein N-acyltransferase [Desulfopila sp. IMCC35006]